MVKIGQDLPLDSKTAQHFIGVCAPFEHFDRYALFKLSVGALGQVNGSHTAAAKFADNCVCTYSLANSIAFVSPESRAGELCKFFENGGIVGQKPFRFAKQCCVVRA